MNTKEYSSTRLRRDRKSWGLCASCGGKRDRTDRLTCAACREKAKKKNAGRYAQNKAYYDAYSTAYYHKRLQSGLCTYCGKNPAMENRRLCDACAGKRRVRDAMRRKVRNIH